MASQTIKKLLTYLMLTVFIAASGLTFHSCYYDNEQELYGYMNNQTCDTTIVTYTATIAPIMSTNCNSCHFTGNTVGYVTDTYTGLEAAATSGRLLGSINHSYGYSAMPKGGNQLTSCDLTKIKVWINRNFPQ